MVVKTNMRSQFSCRTLNITHKESQEATKKLNSGFRINSAKDDASGLAVSEKMKAQIKCLTQASTNTQDGVSLVQTAEGSTNEIHNILNRLQEIAVKTANGTMDNEVDRAALQAEVTELTDEITRISESANFNDIKLLDGSMNGIKSTTTAEIDVKAVGPAPVTPCATEYSIDTSTLAVGDIVSLKSGQSEIAITIVGEDINPLEAGQAKLSDLNNLASQLTVDPIANVSIQSGKITFTTNDAQTYSDVEKNNSLEIKIDVPQEGLVLQVGDTGDDFNCVEIKIDNLSASALGLLSKPNDVLDMSTQQAAADSIESIRDAINKVSTNRSKLGSLQNKLEYTMNSLDTTAENVTAANSTIRDADMAKEMVNYTKNNILSSSMQSTLAHAMQSHSTILELVQ